MSLALVLGGPAVGVNLVRDEHDYARSSSSTGESGHYRGEVGFERLSDKVVNLCL
jgi:hypothetical protein